MKLVMDERLKHRLIGIAVIISLATIFAPAMMKKSHQHIERDYNVKVKLPSKPSAPNVAVSEEKELFKTIKVARVDIPQVSSDKQLSTEVNAEALNKVAISKTEIKDSKDQGLENTQLEPIKLALNDTKPVANSSPSTDKPISSIAPIVTKAKLASKPLKTVATSLQKPKVKQEIYALQLASFSQLANAQSLVNRLKAKGYKASFTKIAARQGFIYKVYVGHSPQKNEVLKLKAQLASAMQLNGFVVNTGVS